MTSSTTPQDRAVQALVQKFNPQYAEYPLAPLSPRGVSAMTSFTASDGHRSIKPLNLGEIVDCLADAGLLSSGTQEEDGSLRSNASGTALRLALLALLNAEQMCQYHGTDFERMGMQRGEPRCDSCKQPFRVKKALAAIEAAHLPKASGEAAKEES